MPGSSVSLGGITLTGHEVPSKIPFGGKHKLAKHVLVGGRRITDAMGPDDCEIRWEGRFRGANALRRARALDDMRRRGAQVPLSWGGLYFLVVIEEFEADYQRSFDLPYRISLYVIDDGAGTGDVGAGLDALVGGDLGVALGLVGAAASSPVGAALGTLGTAIGGVTSLVGVPLGAVAPIQYAAARAVGAIDAALDDADAALVTAGIPDPALLPGPGFAAALVGQAAAFESVDALLRMRGLIGRATVNLNTIAG